MYWLLRVHVYCSLQVRRSQDMNTCHVTLGDASRSGSLRSPPPNRRSGSMVGTRARRRRAQRVWGYDPTSQVNLILVVPEESVQQYVLVCPRT